MSVILFSPSQAPAILDIAKSLTPAGFDLVIANPGTPEFYQAAAEAEYFLGSTRQMGGEFFRAAPKLRLVQLTSAGYDRVDVEAARKAGVPVSNNGGANAIAVAEHTLMLMLAVLKRVVRFHNDVVAGNWRAADSPETRVYELAGRTLGIVGLGNIGKKVARRAAAFDMRVQYYDIARLTLDQEDAIGVRFALFTELLQTSDVVSLHVPLDDSTRKMIGARELGLMKPTAVLVNTCRGPVIDEDALYLSLKERQDRGRRPRRARRRAPRQDAPGLLASQRHAHAPLRRPDLGELDGPLPQRLRQYPASRLGRAPPLGHPRAGRLGSGAVESPRAPTTRRVAVPIATQAPGRAGRGAPLGPSSADVEPARSRALETPKRAQRVRELAPGPAGAAAHPNSASRRLSFRSSYGDR